VNQRIAEAKKQTQKNEKLNFPLIKIKLIFLLIISGIVWLRSQLDGAARFAPQWPWNFRMGWRGFGD
jgi:hypothetical protein